jgi:hypothetical protein
VLLFHTCLFGPFGFLESVDLGYDAPFVLKGRLKFFAIKPELDIIAMESLPVPRAGAGTLLQSQVTRDEARTNNEVRKGGNTPPETGPTPPVPPILSPGLIGLPGPTIPSEC